MSEKHSVDRSDETKGSGNMKGETREKIIMSVLAITFVLNIVAINLFPPTIKELVIVGWTIFGFGALLYIVSVLTLGRRGVSNIVDSGIYGIVRHPMYLGAMAMFLSHIFLGQNWIAAIGTAVAIVCCYLIILSEDQRNAEKFGDEYKRYMEKVPRMNIIVGILRLVHRGIRESEGK